MTFLMLLLPIFLPTHSRAHALAPPILSKTLTSQLVPSNPAISSAFIIPSTSALLANASSPFPALRVPPSWSFSIGFSGATFLPSPGSSQKLSFSAQLENGDPIPDWLVFSQDTITFGGVTPKESCGIQVLKIVVTASTNSNMTTSDAFTLIVSPHDLSLTGPLLTRNVTANNTFSIILDDWNGIQVDGASPNSSALIPDLGEEIHSDWVYASDSTNLSLSLDTSLFPWLKYDSISCTLSGTPPAMLAGMPLPIIPAFVKLSLAQTTQYLIVPTNLTLVVLPSLFAALNLPVLSAPPGTKISFALGSFLTIRGPSLSNHQLVDVDENHISNISITASWDPQNATWLTFDQARLVLSGTVPSDAPGKIQVIFMAKDDMKGTISRSQMRIEVAPGGGDKDGRGILPTDNLRRTGKKIKLAVGVVFGVAAAVILLACFLAICRQCCVAREHIEDVYVIDQSACNQGVPYKSSLEKQCYTSPEAGAVTSRHLEPVSASLPRVGPELGHTMTKAAFFDAMRTRFGSDSSWRSGQHTRTRGTSRNDNRDANERSHTGISLLGSSKRPRKSKISKPMTMLSSSTSVRDGFGERRRGGIGSLVAGKGKGAMAPNFTIFGDANNAGCGGDDGQQGCIPGSGTVRISPDNNGEHAHAPHRYPFRPDVSYAIGRAFMSSPGTAGLGYDRSRSNSDPARNSIHGSPGTVGSPSKRQSGSASAPSLGTGTQSGTQSTFATGDSTRLTNAAGEVPFRRPGFDGRWETLAERSMRETGNLCTERSIGNVGAGHSIGSPLANPQGPFFPLRALVKGTGNMMPQMTTSGSNTPPGSNPTPPKSAMSSKPPMPQSLAAVTSNATSNSSKASAPPTPHRSKTPNNKGSPANPETKSEFSTLGQSGTPIRSVSGSHKSLGAPSSYRKVFFGDKGNESDSSVEDVDNAVITHVVNRSSSETPMLLSAAKGGLNPGKPRLVAFTHERTTAPSGQNPRRDVSQKAVLQSGEDSDADVEMRIGLEYVRQLGDLDSNPESSHKNNTANAVESTTVSASEFMRMPSAEYYASNLSNNSIAGRTRVLAPLVISSHRDWHHAVQSVASTHDSFLSVSERESDLLENRWMVEASLPRFAFSAKEPFNFAVPLDREHKHASALAGSALEAKQADGRSLPEWLRFDKGGKEFWGVTPNAAHGKGGELLVTRIVVKIWDGEKGEVVGGCIVDVFGEKKEGS